MIYLEKQNARRLDRIEQQQRETMLLLSRLSLPPTELWRGHPVVSAGTPQLGVFPDSALCRQESFHDESFAYWSDQLRLTLRYHRKVWELVFICQALWERGALRSGARGLGFGVGREPLPAYFASLGCEIVATDAAAELAATLGWIETKQHSLGLETIRFPHLCEDEAFDRNVTFRTCDMNAVPSDLSDFDFCWSACAFEHLGSIDQGLAFIERIIDCLKPGGWAVHTTEFNVSSNDDTVAKGPTVLFRRRDMETLAARLTAKGHRVAPLNFDAGLRPIDQYIDVAPYREEPHLKLAIDGYAATSFGLIVQRAL